MSLTDHIKEACYSVSADRVGRISDWMRFHCGMSHADQMQAVKRAGVDLDTWDELLQEAD